MNNINEKLSVGEKLKNKMIENRFTIKGLALRTDYSETQISDVLENKLIPTKMFLEKLNMTFNTTNDYWLENKENE